MRVGSLLIALALLPLIQADRPRGRLVTHELSSAALQGNRLGDADTRRVLVYLPPGYPGGRGTRYPVVYLLHAYGEGPDGWLGGTTYEGLDVRAVLDAREADGSLPPTIVVMPDARTRLGGAWYVDSPTSGKWDRFVAQELPAFIDAKYRTVPGREGRGIAGHAMGAYGALGVAMRHPEVFSAVFAVSPSNLLETNPFGVEAMALAFDAVREGREPWPPPARLLAAKAAAFAPMDVEPFMRFPVRRDAGGGVVHDADGARHWSGSALVNQIDEHREALARLAIRLEVGDGDALRAEAQAFARALDGLGLKNVFVVFSGEHTRGVRARFEREVFRFFGRVLARG